MEEGGARRAVRREDSHGGWGGEGDSCRTVLHTPPLSESSSFLSSHYLHRPIVVSVATPPTSHPQIGVDDMDVFKGIELKLLALERLLEMHPEWRGKLVLVQVGRK